MAITGDGIDKDGSNFGTALYCIFITYAQWNNLQSVIFNYQDSCTCAAKFSSFFLWFFFALSLLLGWWSVQYSGSVRRIVGANLKMEQKLIFSDSLRYGYVTMSWIFMSCSLVYRLHK